VFKFKTGVAGLDDVDRLRAARQALGQKVMFTIDYNGAFNDVEGAVASIESLMPFNLALVEQPTHRDRLSLLAQVRKRVDVPILADECIFSPEQLAEAIDLDAFDILSLYPGKNGGFTHAGRMARMAQNAGKTCAIGSNLESDLGQAAMATLAAGLAVFPIPQVPCDLGSSLYYSRSSLKEPLKMAAGELHVPHGVGFGVQPDLPAGF
jgi:muconate cycloisomerase